MIVHNNKAAKKVMAATPKEPQVLVSGGAGAAVVVVVPPGVWVGSSVVEVDWANTSDEEATKADVVEERSNSDVVDDKGIAFVGCFINFKLLFYLTFVFKVFVSKKVIRTLLKKKLQMVGK